jgi:hypothetical protein
MNDITLLGITCVGLGLYCIHLNNRIRRMHKAGLHLTELLMRYVMRKEDCTIQEAAKHVHDLQFEVFVDKITEQA